MRDLIVVVVLMAMLVSQSTAQGQSQFTFSAGFALRRYDGTEGADLSVRLSASVLTGIPINFTGSIEVDITAEDIPGGATFGTDYLVNLTNPLSRIFTVSFLPLQANSTENVIQLSDDITFEGTESFVLRIVQARFTGQAAVIFRADDTLSNAVATVNIADDDFVEVNFTTSLPQEVTEGNGVNVTLRGEAFGLYANQIEIGVICTPVDVSGVPAALPNLDFSFTPGTRIRFTDVGTTQSFSSSELVVPIINDDIAEPCESFICTFQGGALDAVRGIEPNRVTIRICDDDELVVRWATDFYEFGESDPATVQLVTDSVFESATVRIQGFPRHITAAPPRLPSLSDCGPRLPGLSINASIEQAEFRQVVLGNAQLTQSGRTDVVNTINDFVFTPTNKSALKNFTIVDDDVLEFHELFIVEFDFGPEIMNNWNATKGVPSTAFILIRDDDSVVVNFNEDSYTVAESAGQVSVSLRINGRYFVPVWAIVEISDGTATDPEDYSSAVRYNVTFCQTAVTDTQTPARSTVSSPIVIDITDDDIFEGVEYFQARIVETSDIFSVRIGRDTVNVTITDNVTVRYEQKNYTVQEEDGSGILAVVLDEEASIPVTVTVRTLELLNSSYGHAATANVDYTPRQPFEITFPAGSTRQEYTVDITDDFLPENSEFFNADIVSAGPAGVIIGEPRQPVIEILDTVDEVVAIFLDRKGYSIFENEQVVTVTLTLNDTYQEDIIVNVAVGELLDISNNEKAQAGVDFSTAGFPRQETILAGQTTVQFNISVIDELIVERDEHFQVSFTYSGSQPGVVVNQDFDEARITTRNDDALMVMFQNDSYSVREDSGSLLYRVIATSIASFDYQVVITGTDGSATCGSDYHEPVDDSSGTDPPVMSCSYSLTITIPAGSSAADGVVAIINDTIYEGPDDFFLDLSVAQTFQDDGINEGSPLRATVEIEDDDELRVFFDPAVYSVPEGENQVLVLRTDNEFAFPFTIDVTLRDGTAVAPGDYEDRSYQVVFNVTTQIGTLVVHTEAGNIIENDEDFTAMLSVPAGLPRVFEGTPSEATVTILDQTTAEVYFDPATYNVIEGQPADLILRLTGDVDPSVTVIVMVYVMDRSATDGPDYTGGLYTATFSGSSTTSVRVPTLADNVLEALEYFTGVIQVPPDTTTNYRVTASSPDTARVNIIDATIDMSHDKSASCPTNEDSVWGIQWLAIATGSIRSAPCSGEGSSSVDGLAYRRCLAGVPAEWGSVNASACESVAGRAVREKTDEFISSLEMSNRTNRNLTDKERNKFQNITHDLSAVLDPSDERNRSILPQDLKTAAKFVEVVADLGENNGLFREESNETEEAVADILSNVLDERNAPAFETTAQTDSTDPESGKVTTLAVSILQSTERVANVIGTTLSKTKPSFSIARPNLAINGQRFSYNNLRTGIVFPGSGIRDTLASFRNQGSLPQIHLPQAFLRAAKGIEASLDDDTVEVVNVVMNNMENYVPRDVIKQDKDVEEEAEETLPASRVISSQILGYDGGEVDTKERVEVTFPVNVKSQSLPVPPGKVKQFRCAFFNFSAEEGNQTGGWSYRGVETDVINATHVRCIASHLTSFAVLVSIVPSVGEPPALDYITYIGCSISLLCLLASIIFYLTLRKELIHKLHNFVHLNLCIALSLGLLFFLTGIQTATANIYACKVMTALLHYFFLATFTWTLCEAILIYILLVKVFGANERKWIYLYLALGWVLPIPVVVITGGARHDYYLIRASFDQSHPHYNSIKACWLPTENGVIFAFIGPMVAILLVNAVLLTISLVSLARSQCGRVSSRNDEKRQKYIEVGKQLLKTTIILVPLLGFTWIIGLFAVGEEGKAFAYLFVFANVFQGVFIFVLHVLRHEKVYGKIKGKLPNISKLVTAYTGSASSSAKSTHASTSDTRKVSFALESEAIIESGVKKDEDAESIKDGDDQDIKLDVIYEDIQDVEGNGCEEAHAVATTALDMSADTTGALDETEEKAKGDSTEDHAGQTCAEFTSGEQSGNEAGGVVDNN